MRWCCGGHNSTASSSSSNQSKDAVALTTSEWKSNKSGKKGLLSAANGSKNSGTAASLILRGGQADVRLLKDTEYNLTNNFDGQVSSAAAALTNNSASGAQKVLKSSLKLLKGPGRKSSTDSFIHQKHKAKVQYADKLVVDESLEEEDHLKSQQKNNSQISNKRPPPLSFHALYYSVKEGNMKEELPLFSSHQQSIFYGSSSSNNEPQNESQWSSLRGFDLVKSENFHSSKPSNNLENFEKYGPMLLKPCKIVSFFL